MRQFLSLADHAADLSLSVRTVRNAISLGRWPAKTVLLGRRRLVPLGEHQRLVAALIREGKIPLDGSWDAPVAASQTTEAPVTKRRIGRPRKPYGLPHRLR